MPTELDPNLLIFVVVIAGLVIFALGSVSGRKK